MIWATFGDGVCIIIWSRWFHLTHGKHLTCSKSFCQDSYEILSYKSFFAHLYKSYFELRDQDGSRLVGPDAMDLAGQVLLRVGGQAWPAPDHR